MPCVFHVQAWNNLNSSEVNVSLVVRAIQYLNIIFTKSFEIPDCLLLFLFHYAARNRRLGDYADTNFKTNYRSFFSSNIWNNEKQIETNKISVHTLNILRNIIFQTHATRQVKSKIFHFQSYDAHLQINTGRFEQNVSPICLWSCSNDKPEWKRIGERRKRKKKRNTVFKNYFVYRGNGLIVAFSHVD